MEASPTNLTLVSAYIDLAQYDPQKQYGPTRRGLEFYLPHLRAFLQLEVPKVVFLESHMLKALQRYIDPRHTHVVPFQKEEMQLWPRRDMLMKLPRPATDNPSKDTTDFFMVMHEKVNWCARATACNPFNTTHFAWMDMGIDYVFQRYQRPLANLVQTLDISHMSPGKIRIPGCWPLPTTDSVDMANLPTGLTWYFCGGFFAGDVDAIQRFQQLQQQVLDDMIANQRLFIWETTTWFHVACRAPDLFNWYASDHTPQMILDF